MCWAAAAWWAAVRVSRAVLQTKVLIFLGGLADFFYAVFSSPGMMVPVHAGRGHLHATRPPVVLET